MGSPLETLPSSELLRRLQRLVQRGQVTEAELLAHLGEIDARRLYLEQACPSMFVYCVRVLHFAEGVAYKRIQVARAARRHPELREATRRGELHVTAANLLTAQLTRENAGELIGAAKHRTAEQVRVLLANRKPRPEVPASARRIPEALPAKVAMAPVPESRPEVPEKRRTPVPSPAVTRPEPLGGERYCVRFTADRETYAQLQELRALLRHQVPDGDLAKILARAISGLLAQVRRRKFADTATPKSPKVPSPNPSRAIPAAFSQAESQKTQPEQPQRPRLGHDRHRHVWGRRCAEPVHRLGDARGEDQHARSGRHQDERADLDVGIYRERRASSLPDWIGPAAP